MDWKEDGKEAYERGDFKHALESYQTAVKPEYECPSKADQAVIWSNIVACRLQLAEGENGVTDLSQAQAAVDDAKQCVSLNPNWAKGYVRLASAYIALGGHSNDACNALQSALRIDPGNSQARQMLVRELRRDHATAHSQSSASSTNSAASTSARETVEEFRDPPNNPTFAPSSSSFVRNGTTNTRQSTSSASPGRSHQNTASTAPVDDGLTWRERVSFRLRRVSDWYQNLNPDVKTAIKIGIIIFILYLAFGGRFGFESTSSSSTSRDYGTPYDNYYRDTATARTTKGNYGENNAYEQYYRQKRQQTQYASSQSHQPRRDNNYDRGGGYYESYHYTPRQSSYSFSIANLFDGSVQSMVILAGIAYICHKSGINPFQAIMMLNLMGGGRRVYYGGYYGGGFGHPRRF